MSAAAPDLAGKVALVTGASAGIGAGIAAALAAAGAEVHGIARAGGAGAYRWHPVDLGDPAAIAGFLAGFAPPRLDILVHGAGLLTPDGFTAEQGDPEAGLAALDRQLQVNLRAPWQLTAGLLPRLIAAKGWVVMLNSSIWMNARAGLAGYAASKYALRAMTDALRAEVNGRGVRVLSVYPGRTASRMQAEASQAAGAPYHPERLLQPEAIAGSVLSALALPETAEVTDLHIRPALKG
ncbi:SDR family NAD(P)-dependent oxidoreductase [Amaricoccus solimangrovi]|uniref:SDR family NAD(P)-dependent oxidoreductase n=1 Tax=Amaricoccus solimangrovi TaxID=2589815 RepID=A0A501WRM3_9RHOB|nr:SDR family NAD(P)-dependent oxidoreductase [Amaricoccus solimangrovi]TPE48416.1 SDR family NAD(P)-dependent oxidoreductase [Amaricoccus solimangrovi]